MPECDPEAIKTKEEHFMRKKRVTALMLTAVLALVAVGCGSENNNAAGEGGSNAAQSGPETADSDVEQSGEAEVTLRFLDVSPSETRQKYYEEIFVKFEEETGISVVYESVPWDDAANKITVLGASDQLPDVLTTHSGWLGQLTNSEWIIPLTDYLGESTEDYTVAVNKLFWQSEKDRFGDIYTIPDGMMVKGIFVRKDWCEELGIELDPAKGWTYDEYFEVVEKLTDVEKKHYGVSYRGARGAFDPLMTYLQNYTGGNTYDSEGNILIKSDECREAFQKWTGLYLNGYAPEDSINWGFTEMVDNFVGGLTGTLMNDSEVAPTCMENMEDGQWMVMPVPKSEKDGKLYNLINGSYSLSISSDSKNPDAAWQLIEFLTRTDNSSNYCRLSGLIPIKKDAAEDELYGEGGPYYTFTMQLNDPDLVVPATIGAFDYTDMHQGMMHEEIQKYLLGDIDADTALNTIADELESRMKDYIKEHPDTSVENALVMQ